MTMTMAEALTASEFHTDEGCGLPRKPKTNVPRSNAKSGPYRWRRNGATKLWKTRPTEFRIPVKYGLYAYGYVTEAELRNMHPLETCPRNGQEGTSR